MLFSPIKINTLEIKNRLVMAPMGLGYTRDNQVNERIVAFFRERARGGVGLIDVGGVRIHETGGGANVIALDDDRFIPGLKKLTHEVHEHDTRIIAQLYHPGGLYPSVYLGGNPPVSSSAVRSGLSKETPRAMTLEEISQMQGYYTSAALRAREVGFDGIDIIGAAGYLISQFLSPIRNLRDDAYGGSLENRMRFALEIVDQIRSQAGKDFPIFFKMAANEFMQGGNRLLEGMTFARELEQAGVDCILTAGGWHETRVPQLPMSVPDGTWLYMAKKLKEAVQIPVITCNQIRDPHMAEQVIRDGLADMVGMGRQLLADPHYANKVKEDRTDDINYCIGCLQGCFDTVQKLGSVSCLVNPEVGREYEMDQTPSAVSKKVMVLGGGPGGMEAALVASLKGHQVTLCEKSEKLGGQLPYVAAPSDRRKFNLFENYLIHQMEKHGIDVRLNCDMTSDEILASNPDAVVLATGALPIVPDIPGVDLPHVHGAWDVLMDRKAVGKEVVVIGGGATGCETALFLAEKGTLSPEALHYLFVKEAEDVETLREMATKGVKGVTIVEMLPKMGRDIGAATRWSILQDLRRFGVKLITGAEAMAIEKEAVVIFREGRKEHLSCDSVILALGSKSHNPLEVELRKKLQDVHVIGDAKGPRKALDAVHEGFDVGYQI